MDLIRLQQQNKVSFFLTSRFSYDSSSHGLCNHVGSKPVVQLGVFFLSLCLYLYGDIDLVQSNHFVFFDILNTTRYIRDEVISITVVSFFY